MVDADHAQLSIVRQCGLLRISRSSLYYKKKGESEENLHIMREIDKAYMESPFFGARQMRRHLALLGYAVGIRRVRRLMRLMGLRAVYQRPKTSIPNAAHKRYPYLLRGMTIDRSNQVWCADITYIPLRKGFLYLVAVMDWHSRKVLSWRLSNVMDSDFCVLALEEALARYGVPAIFNTDQGSQFTSQSFTSVLSAAGIRISMDGRGRWRDNVFIERLWRSLKYEEVYLKAYESGSEARAGIGQWMDFYNHRRPHSSLCGITPSDYYQKALCPTAA
jgi:putative transposase